MTKKPSVEFEFIDALGIMCVAVCDGKNTTRIQLNETGTAQVLAKFNPAKKLEELAHEWRSADVNMAAVQLKIREGDLVESKEREFESGAVLAKAVDEFIQSNPVLIALIDWRRVSSTAAERFLRIAIDRMTGELEKDE